MRWWQRISKSPGQGGRVFALQAATYAGLNVISTLCRMAGGILSVRYVDPVTLGLFSGFTLVETYAPIALAGVPDGLARNYPLHMGAGCLQKARRLASTAQAWSLLLAAVFLVVLWTMGGVAFARNRAQFGWGWLTVGASVAMMFYGISYLLVTYRTTAHFQRLAISRVISAMLGLAAVALVVVWGFGGLCARLLIMGGSLTMLLWFWRPVRVSPAWHGAAFRELTSVGLPIGGVQVVGKLWGALTPTLVLAVLGTHDMGLYSMANVVLVGLAILPEAFAEMLYPRLTQAYGKRANPEEAFAAGMKVSAAALGVCIPVIVAAWLFLPFLIERVFPKYVEGTAAAQWALLVAAMTSFRPMQVVFNVVRRQRQAFLASLAGIAGHLAMLSPCLLGQASLVLFVQALLVGRIIQVVVGFALLRRCVRFETLGA